MAVSVSLCASAHATDSTADTRAVAVVLHSDGPEPTFAEMQSALADELGVPAVAADSQGSSAVRGVLTVTYHAATKELAISNLILILILRKLTRYSVLLNDFMSSSSVFISKFCFVYLKMK